MSVLQIIGSLFLVAGAGFGLIGAIGLLRFPDFFTRLHAGSITDTMCASLILIGLMLHSQGALPVVKLFIILFFLLFTTPTATHALAKAALHGGCEPLLKTSGKTKGTTSSNRSS